MKYTVFGSSYRDGLRTLIEQRSGVWLAWAGAPDPGMYRFMPTVVADAVLALDPNLPVGAVLQYVWTMAFAPTRGIAATAFANLTSLVEPYVRIDVLDDYSQEGAL